MEDDLEKYRQSVEVLSKEDWRWGSGEGTN